MIDREHGDESYDHKWQHKLYDHIIISVGVVVGLCIHKNILTYKRCRYSQYYTDSILHGKQANYKIV